MSDLQELETNPEAKNMGALVHAVSFAGYIIPLGSVLGPLIVWLMKRDEFAFANECGKSCLNFKISVMLYAFVCMLLMFVGVGFILIGALALFDIVCTILAIIRATEGKVYQYPMSIKFLK